MCLGPKAPKSGILDHKRAWHALKQPLAGAGWCPAAPALGNFKVGSENMLRVPSCWGRMVRVKGKMHSGVFCRNSI